MAAFCSWGTWRPHCAEAQQPKKVWRIGFLSSMAPGPYAHLYNAFQQGLGDLGYIDGQNVMIKARWAEGNTERLPELAADLVEQKVDLIVSTGGLSPRWRQKRRRPTPRLFSPPAAILSESD